MEGTEVGKNVLEKSVEIFQQAITVNLILLYINPDLPSGQLAIVNIMLTINSLKQHNTANKDPS